MQCCGVQFLKINMIQNIMLQFNSFTAQNDKFLCLEPEPESARTLGFRSRCPQHWVQKGGNINQCCGNAYVELINEDPDPDAVRE